MNLFAVARNIGVAVAALVLTSCGGTSNSSSLTEFVYVATGTNVAQYSIDGAGQLTPLAPPIAASTNAVAVATTHDSRFAYAANKAQNTLSQYSIGPDGTLTPLTPATVAAGTGPVAVVAAPNGKFVYSLAGAGNVIAQFKVEADGTLTALSPGGVSVAAGGNSLVVSPNSSFLYATSYSSGKISAYAIGLDGKLAPLTVPTYDVVSPTGPAMSPDGAFLYCPLSGSAVAQFLVGFDGSLTPMTPPTVTTPFAGDDSVALSPNGLFAYVGAFNGGVDNSPVMQFNVNSNGTLTPQTSPFVTAGNAPQFVGVDPDGKFAYVANGNDGTVSEFSINVNGSLTALTPTTVNPGGAIQIAFARR